MISANGVLHWVFCWRIVCRWISIHKWRCTRSGCLKNRCVNHFKLILVILVLIPLWLVLTFNLKLAETRQIEQFCFDWYHQLTTNDTENPVNQSKLWKTRASHQRKRVKTCANELWLVLVSISDWSWYAARFLNQSISILVKPKQHELHGSGYRWVFEQNVLWLERNNTWRPFLFVRGSVTLKWQVYAGLRDSLISSNHTK